MLESSVEKYLREQVEDAGGMCEKHTAPGRRDVPDRLVSWPRIGKRGEMDVVETKQPGKKPRDGQLRDHKRRAALGIPTYLIDTKDKVDRYVRMRRDGQDPFGLHSILVLV